MRKTWFDLPIGADPWLCLGGDGGGGGGSDDGFGGFGGSESNSDMAGGAGYDALGSYAGFNDYGWGVHGGGPNSYGLPGITVGGAPEGMGGGTEGPGGFGVGGGFDTAGYAGIGDGGGVGGFGGGADASFGAPDLAGLDPMGVPGLSLIDTRGGRGAPSVPATAPNMRGGQTVDPRFVQLFQQADAQAAAQAQRAIQSQPWEAPQGSPSSVKEFNSPVTDPRNPNVQLFMQPPNLPAPPSIRGAPNPSGMRGPLTDFVRGLLPGQPSAPQAAAPAAPAIDPFQDRFSAVNSPRTMVPFASRVGPLNTPGGFPDSPAVAQAPDPFSSRFGAAGTGMNSFGQPGQSTAFDFNAGAPAAPSFNPSDINSSIASLMTSPNFRAGMSQSINNFFDPQNAPTMDPSQAIESPFGAPSRAPTAPQAPQAPQAPAQQAPALTRPFVAQRNFDPSFINPPSVTRAVPEPSPPLTPPEPFQNINPTPAPFVPSTPQAPPMAAPPAPPGIGRSPLQVTVGPGGFDPGPSAPSAPASTFGRGGFDLGGMPSAPQDAGIPFPGVMPIPNPNAGGGIPFPGVMPISPGMGPGGDQGINIGFNPVPSQSAPTLGRALLSGPGLKRRVA